MKLEDHVGYTVRELTNCGTDRNDDGRYWRVVTEYADVSLRHAHRVVDTHYEQLQIDPPKTRSAETEPCYSSVI